MIEAGLVQPGLVKRGLVSAIIEAQSRYFNFFDGVQEYVQLAQPVTLSGDFEIEFDALSRSASAPNMVLGNSADNNNNGIFINANDVFARDSTGNTTFTDGDVFTSNILRHVRIVKIGTSVTIFVNGSQSGSGTSSAPFVLDLLCARKSIVEFVLDGIIANVRITDNGTLIHNWSINDNSNVIADSVGSNNGTLVNPSGGWGLFDKQSDGDYLGQELVVNGGFDSPDNWTLTDPTITISGGVAEFSSTPAFNNITQDIGFSYNTEYRTNINISQYSQGSIRIQLEGVQGTNRVSDGTFQEDLITAASGATRLFIRNTTVSTIGVDSISVKQLLRVA